LKVSEANMSLPGVRRFFCAGLIAKFNEEQVALRCSAVVTLKGEGEIEKL